VFFMSLSIFEMFSILKSLKLIAIYRIFDMKVLYVALKKRKCICSGNALRNLKRIANYSFTLCKHSTYSGSKYH